MDWHLAGGHHQPRQPFARDLAPLRGAGPAAHASARHDDGDALLSTPSRRAPAARGLAGDFYVIRLSAQTAAQYSQFAAASGDDVGQDNKDRPREPAGDGEAGQSALLMAMHVTGKEISNWTWQTFWWALDPQDPLSGRDRPAGIGKPWSRYNMGTAYYMVTPTRSATGTPLVSSTPTSRPTCRAPWPDRARPASPGRA